MIIVFKIVFLITPYILRKCANMTFEDKYNLFSKNDKKKLKYSTIRHVGDPHVTNIYMFFLNRFYILRLFSLYICNVKKEKGKRRQIKTLKTSISNARFLTKPTHIRGTRL